MKTNKLTNKDVFEELYREWYPKVRNLASKWRISSIDSRDLAQLSFVKLIEGKMGNLIPLNSKKKTGVSLSLIRSKKGTISSCKIISYKEKKRIFSFISLSYLTKIVVNLVRTEIKNNKRWQSYNYTVGSIKAQLLSNNIKTPEENEEWENKINDTKIVLANMKTEDSEAIRLFYGERMSHKEAAHHLSITKHAFGSRLHRAKNRLRIAL